MQTQEITTTNLVDFGYRELKMLQQLLKAMEEQGLPDGFSREGVHAMFNRNSGWVFLTNEDYQTAMLNGDKLEVWHHCPDCGCGGFEQDYHCSMFGEGECIKYGR